MSKIFICFIIVLIVVCAFAQIPQTMVYQGKLTDEFGVGFNGDYDLMFVIYDSIAVGDSLWAENHNAVAFEKGIFTVVLGDSEPLGLPFDEQYYLEIRIEGTPILPRMRLTTSPYAFRAIFADSCAGGTVGEQDTFIAHWDSLRNIPAHFADGDDIGFEQLRADHYPWLTDNATFVAGANIALTQTGDSITIAAIGGAGDSDWQIVDDDMYAIPDSFVGIGITSPRYKLHVEDSIDGDAFDSTDAVAYFKNTSPTMMNFATAVYGDASTNDWSIGGVFKGGEVGVLGKVVTNSGTSFYGVKGQVSKETGTGVGTFYGVYGIAMNGATNYGVYGSAWGGTTDWAGYFSGDVNVTSNLNVLGSYYDSNDEPGTNGQVLSSTVGGTDWIDAPSSSQWTSHASNPYIYANNNISIAVYDFDERGVLYVDEFGDLDSAYAIIGRNSFESTFGILGSGLHNGVGVYGEADGAVESGIYGYNPNSSGWAGYFDGDVHITGDLTMDGNADYLLSNAPDTMSASTSSNLLAVTNSGSGRAIYARISSATNYIAAIKGEATSATGATQAIAGWISSTHDEACAVYGIAQALSGSADGVTGQTLCPDGYGGYFFGGQGLYASDIDCDGEVTIDNTGGGSYCLSADGDRNGYLIEVENINATGSGMHINAHAIGLFAQTDSDNLGYAAVKGRSNGDAPAIFGEALSTGPAGYFDGNVGIGTDSPGSPLHIKLSGSSIADGLRMETSLATGEDWYVYMNATDDLVFRNDATDLVIIQKDDGYVGIGTISPNSKLHINSAVAEDGLRVQVAGATKLLVNSNGGVTVGTNTTPPANGLYVADWTGIGESTPEGILHIREDSVHVILDADEEADAKIVFRDADAPTDQVFEIAFNAADQDLHIRSDDNSFEDIMTIRNGGNIGIGQPSPGSHKLYVESDGSGTNGSTVFIENTSATGIGMIVEATSSDLPLLVTQRGAGDIFRCDSWTGGWHAVFKVDNAGQATCNVLEILGGSDLSEQFEIDATDVQPGMVVSIDTDNPGKLKIAETAYDRKVAGIVSGAGGIKTGMMMGQTESVADGEYPVALTGRVYVMADASSGAIEPGDLLTSSDVPGYAMKVTDHYRANGAIIGKAMTSLDEGQGLVLVLISLQ